MPQDLVSGIIAHGGVGKSMLGAMLSIAVATGETIGPFRPLLRGAVLYLDWENNHLLHARRIKRICDGLRIPFPENLIHYEARGKLVTAESEIIELAHEHDVVFTMLDSIGYAAGGNLNDSDVATAATTVLKHLPGTKGMVAHVAKITLESSSGAGRLGPTGSAFFWNGPQSIYELRATDPALDGSVVFSLYQNKANVGARLPRPLGVHVAFDDGDDNSGPITPTAVTIRGDAPGGEAMGMPQRVMDCLLRSREMLSIKEITAALFDPMTAGNENSVGRTLRALTQQGKLHDFGRSPIRYGLAAREDAYPGKMVPEGSGLNLRFPPESLICHRCGDAAGKYSDTGQPVCEVHAL